MKDSFTPKAILTDVAQGKINKPLAVDLLLSLIEKSNNPELRRACLISIQKLDIPKESLEKVYKTIESCLLSDENPFVRSSAAVLISKKFLKYGIDALRWSVQHDRSPLVLKALIDLFLENSNIIPSDLTENLQKWLLGYANKIGIIFQEAPFFLEIESLFAKNIKNYKISNDSFKYFKYIATMPSSNPFILIHNHHVKSLNFNYYYWLYLKKNQDIIGSFTKIKDLNTFLSLQKQYDLMFKDLIKIPSFIGDLTHLKVLNLSGNDLRTIPSEIFSLSNLQELNLIHNKIKEIPVSISKLKFLKVLNLKSNCIHNIPSELDDYLGSLDKFDY